MQLQTGMRHGRGKAMGRERVEGAYLDHVVRGGWESFLS